jgi:Holliday junction resolvase RusA-like endonuclease
MFYPSWRQDVDLAIVYDMLQKTGVVSNDRWIRERHEFGLVDVDKPRVEIDIEEI